MAGHMQVVIADRNYEAAVLAADEIKTNGGQAFPVAVDVSVASSVARMTQEVAGSVGEVHALFCNAGISPKKPFEDWSEADWDSVIHTHIKGVFLCTQAFLPQMCNRKEGAIVTSGSDYSIVGHVHGSGYAAAKAGIYSLTKSIALEFAPYNIRCNSVGPGPIETPLKSQRGERVPMGRMGKPEEVASVVDFLVSDRAAYITGQIIHPNGGCVMW